MTSFDTTLICGILPNPPVFWRIILLNTSCVVDVPISIPALKISSVCILLLLQKLFFSVCVCRSPYNCAVVFYLRQPGFHILVQSGISYGINKNPACRILRLRRVALATSFVSAAVRSLESFLCNRKGVSYYIKKSFTGGTDSSREAFDFSHPPGRLPAS